jgi:hypothetical protein
MALVRSDISDGRGRILVVSQDVPRGSLILVCYFEYLFLVSAVFKKQYALLFPGRGACIVSAPRYTATTAREKPCHGSQR